MDTRWRTALGTTGVLAIGLLVGAACAAPRMMAPGAGATANEERINVEYDATKGDRKDRVRAKKHDGADAEEFERCTIPKQCRLGFPVRRNGTEVLGNVTAIDEVLILSDVASPGRTCVCYGNKCYCN
jgi:hypothetical protein